MCGSQTVFITGADKGLGFALVRTFLREGFIVFAGLYDPKSDLSSLHAAKEMLFDIPLDVSQMESIKKAAQLVKESGHQLDILINNAGIFLEDKRLPLEEDPFDDGRFKAQMLVNAYGPVRMIQQFLPLMKEDGLRRLTTISSESGSLGECWRDREFGYGMSKAALNMGLLLIHRYLTPRGFRSLALHPGWMRTDMGGPEAARDPMESAQDVYDLTLQERGSDDPIYLNFDGRPMAW